MSEPDVRWIVSTESKPWQERAASPVGAPPVDLAVTGRLRQAWQGFGGCFNELGWQALCALPRDRRDAVLQELFHPEEGCRFNFCRLPIGASDYAESWYSHDETPGDFAMEHFSIERDRGCLVPYIKAALEYRPDMNLFASPWSPPTWMKHPRAYNYGQIMPEERYLRAYALYFLKFVQAYRAEGIEIGHVHVQNEPDSNQKFPSCTWTGAGLRDFIRDYLGPLFEEAGEPCEIWAGTLERPQFDDWANLILSDPEARRHVGGVGYQWAGKGAVQRTHMAWPDVPIVQTENECGDGMNSWDYAGYVFSLMHHYIANGAVAYVYWNMVLAPGGRSTWGWAQNSMLCADPATGTVACNPEFYVMKHLSHFVEPGARLAEVGGCLAGNALAFVNPDGSTVVAVHNAFDRERDVTLSLGERALSARLPARSFNSFVVESP